MTYLSEFEGDQIKVSLESKLLHSSAADKVSSQCVDLALAEVESSEIGGIQRALAKLDSGDYGACEGWASHTARKTRCPILTDRTRGSLDSSSRTWGNLYRICKFALRTSDPRDADLSSCHQ